MDISQITHYGPNETFTSSIHSYDTGQNMSIKIIGEKDALNIEVSGKNTGSNTRWWTKTFRLDGEDITEETEETEETF